MCKRNKTVIYSIHLLCCKKTCKNTRFCIHCTSDWLLVEVTFWKKFTLRHDCQVRLLFRHLIELGDEVWLKIVGNKYLLSL